jgi:hypothetical protein
VNENKEATIYGLISAAVLSNLPPWVLGYGEKLAYAAILASFSGFAYAAGKWAWEWLVKRRG